MNKPDLMITWHESCDYPIARRFLRRYRDFFGKLIIYFSKHFREPVYTPFLKESMKDLNAILLDPVEYEYGVSDWRNIATHEMLKHSDSEWTCSVEQDFFCRDWNKLLGDITEASKTFDFIGYKGYQGQQGHIYGDDYLTGNYVHPSFWFMKRSTLERTNIDFSADPRRGCDHFGLITQDAEKLQIPIYYIQDHGWKEMVDCYHQGGINMNYLEFDRPGFIIHRPELFYIYNHFSMVCGENQDQQFYKLCEHVKETMKPQFPDMLLETTPWRVFYT